MKDYSKHINSTAWLRHPAMGDPSFDTFEKVHDTAYISKPPYLWAVNGSLYEDKDGAWYLYAGLYLEGYSSDMRSYAETLRSLDKGKTWENLGETLETGFVLDRSPLPWHGCPDMVLNYDHHTGKYLLTFDGGTTGRSWETAYKQHGLTDGGASAALGDSPAGPFTPTKHHIISNNRSRGTLGRFLRLYATTIIPREHDYLALTLVDSDSNYAWGLVGCTSPDLEKEFTMPKLLLSCDRDTYYPGPVEYYPAFVHEGKVYAPATSVCMNRNYQFMFAADLEKAHEPDAWELVADGNLWHSRPIDDEYYGIWGQTFNGFIDKDGYFTVMYPARDKRGYGTLSVARRPWDKPLSDGFTFSGHDGPSVTVLREAYKEFSLDMDYVLSRGSFEVIFGFDGKLGAKTATSNCVPCDSAMNDSLAVRISGKDWAIRDHSNIIASGSCEALNGSIRIVRTSDKVAFYAGDTLVCSADMPKADFAPIGLTADRFSHVECSKFVVDGESIPATFRYNDYDALLGGGWGKVNYREEHGALVGSKRVKWNAHGVQFSITGISGPGYGKANVVLDGEKIGVIDFSADEVAEKLLFVSDEIPAGAHGIALVPVEGEFPVPNLLIKQG